MLRRRFEKLRNNLVTLGEVEKDERKSCWLVVDELAEYVALCCAARGNLEITVASNLEAVKSSMNSG